MQIDPEYLRQHYGSLSDEGLLAINHADLVETARMILDLEVARRKLARRRPDPPDETEDDEAEVDGETYGGGEEPDWLEDAAEVSSYCVPSRSAPAPDSAVDARDALEAAGIPWYFDICEIPPEKSLLPYGTHRWRVMVPGKLYLRATGVVEREISNPEFETGWKTHLEALSDEELRALRPQVVFCGLFDRVARVNRVYDEEIARRRLK